MDDDRPSGGPLPLPGLTVLDASQMLAGPLCAMARTQRPDGDWCALAGGTQSTPESSAAAFFATAGLRTRRLGVAGTDLTEAVDRAVRVTRSRVDGDGRLSDVSAVAWSSTRETHYDHVSTGHVVPWGHPVILMLHELELAGAATGSDR